MGVMMMLMMMHDYSFFLFPHSYERFREGGSKNLIVVVANQK
jgi:hypothetical protein